MAEELADSTTASVSAPGSWSNGSYSLNNVSDTITLTNSGHAYANTTITNGGYTFANTSITNNGVATGSLGPYTVSTGISQPWYSNSTTVSKHGGKIQLDGDGADIEVNGWSLMDSIQKIEERLNILHPNEKMEAEWEELRALGEQYRKLEQHIKDKQSTWDKLKAMPPPVVD